MSFYHDYGICYGINTLFLDKEGRNWITQKIVRTGTRSPEYVKMEIYTLQKVVFLKSGLWGSGSWGHTCHLYKKTSNEYQEVGRFALFECYSVTGFAGLATKDSVVYKFLDKSKIELTHHFNVMTQHLKPQFLIKNKIYKDILAWNADQQYFESIRKSEEGSSFYFECEDTLKQIYQDASEDIRRSMRYFATQHNLNGIPPQK